jgi:hypothetical protein
MYQCGSAAQHPCLPGPSRTVSSAEVLSFRYQIGGTRSRNQKIVGLTGERIQEWTQRRLKQLYLMQGKVKVQP